MLEQGFITCASLAAGGYIFSLIGASIYDLRQVRAEREYRKHPHAKRYRQRPLVSVVVSAHDDSEIIVACLNSIRTSSYRKVEVIVVDHASSDDTCQLVKQFQTDHPSLPLRLVCRRSATDMDAAISLNTKKYAKGKLILMLEGSSWLDKTAIAQAVRIFNTKPNTAVVSLRTQVVSAYSTLGLLQRYQELFSAKARKARAILMPGQDTALMPLMRPVDKGAQGFCYLHDAAVYQKPYTFKEYAIHLWRIGQTHELVAVTVRWQRYGLGLVMTLSKLVTSWVLLGFVGYFFYLAVAMHEPAFFLLLAAVLAGMGLFNIWDEGSLSVVKKLGYSLLLPITSFGLIIATLLKGAQALIDLLRLRRLTA